LNFERDTFLLGDSNTLYPLHRGFDLLAQHLATVESSEVLHRRRDNNYPRFVAHTSLKRFPFQHTVAFLDLSDDARARLIVGLKKIAKHFATADVSKVRNDQLHFRRSNSDLAGLARCLTEVEMAVKLMEELGFCRILFRFARSIGDEASRNLIVLENSRGREIAFSRPSPYTWLRLPPTGQPQYLMTGAVFAEPNEMLRFRPRHESEFAEMWMNFPKRRKGNIKAAESGIAGGPSDSEASATLDV
jgi:hypothetical protein